MLGKMSDSDTMSESSKQKEGFKLGKDAGEPEIKKKGSSLGMMPENPKQKKESNLGMMPENPKQKNGSN